MRLFPTLCSALVLASVSLSQDSSAKFVYRDEARSGGKLAYVRGIPVITLKGTPDQIGEQYGSIAIKQGKDLIDQVEGFVAEMGWKAIYPLMLRTSGRMIDQFPKDHRTELLAAAKASGIEKNLLVFANTVADLRRIGGCSTLVVEKGRSQTGEPLFGRNLDWPPFPGLAEHSLLVVCKPLGKHAFASLTIAPLIGVMTGMNDAGLCITINEIYQSADKSDNVDFAGTPMMMLFRRVLEECTTLAEAEKLMMEAKRTGMYVLTICDKSGGCNLEVTTKNVVRRVAENDLCCCTNHFRTSTLGVNVPCKRYDLLAKTQQGDAKLNVVDVIYELDQVNQGKATVHSVVFEPARLVIHVSVCGTESATKKAFKEIELNELFK